MFQNGHGYSKTATALEKQRPHGRCHDVVVVTTDTGVIVGLEYVKTGKSGCVTEFFPISNVTSILHDPLTSNLFDTIQSLPPEVQDEGDAMLEQVIDVIGKMTKKANPDDFREDGGPDTRVIESHIGKKLGRAYCDKAWAEFKKRRNLA
jgi:hypothetical protein